LAFILNLQEPSFRYKLALISLLSIIIGMFASRAMMSIGMILIGVQFFLKKDLAETFRLYYRDKILFLLSFIFLIYLISIFNTEHIDDFWPRLTIKLPLLFMPLGFAALKEMPVKYFQHILYAFLLFALITAAISVAMYIMHYQEITESYKSAKVIPNIFGISHIRFSLMLVTACFSALYLFRQEYFLIKKGEKYLIAFAGIFILAFIHLLSVRSGLLAFYATAFAMVASRMIIFRQYLTGAILLLFILLAPFLAYQSIPTVRNKVDYMVTDVSRFLQGKNVNRWSDGNRLLSLQIGIELGKEHLLTGIGAGDVEKDMAVYYEKYHPEISKENHLIPHSQFVYVFTACGLIGLIIFTIVTFYPFFLRTTYYSELFLAVNVIILTSYISEATLENQLGVCLLVTFYLIGWQTKKMPDTR